MQGLLQHILWAELRMAGSDVALKKEIEVPGRAGT